MKGSEVEMGGQVACPLQAAVGDSPAAPPELCEGGWQTVSLPWDVAPSRRPQVFEVEQESCISGL